MNYLKFTPQLEHQQLSAYLRTETGNGTNHSPHDKLRLTTIAPARIWESTFKWHGQPASTPTQLMTNNSPFRTNLDSPAHKVAREDIRASAEKNFCGGERVNSRMPRPCMQ